MRSSTRPADPGLGGAPAYCTLEVKVIPGASRDSLSWDPARGWVVRITAPPVDGKANIYLCRYLAREVLGLTARQVVVRSGASSRQKLLEVALSAEELELRLAPLRERP